MTATILSPAEVRERIQAACVEAGSQIAFAERAGVSTSFLSNVLAGRRTPGAKLLRLMGLQKAVFYQAK